MKSYWMKWEICLYIKKNIYERELVMYVEWERERERERNKKE